MLNDLPHSISSSDTRWSASDIQYARHELAKEYPKVARAVIDLVIAHCETTLAPAEGRVRLMAYGRRKLSDKLFQREAQERLR